MPTRVPSRSMVRHAKLGTPRQSLARRIAFSSEDRRAEGIVAELTVAENIVLGIQARRGWLRRLPRSEQQAVVSELITALGVRPANPNQLAGNLSGGNQQKVLLARWLATDPQLIILDEPTRGIDVGAKADIQRKVAELSEKRIVGHLHLIRTRGSASIGAKSRRDERSSAGRTGRLERGGHRRARRLHGQRR